MLWIFKHQPPKKYKSEVKRVGIMETDAGDFVDRSAFLQFQLHDGGTVPAFVSV